MITVLAALAGVQRRTHLGGGSSAGGRKMNDVVMQVQSALGERYRVERELGRGGMATVYLAEDLKHHRRVAVKVLRPELAAAVGEKRFLREIDIAANLSHPGILPLHDSGGGDGLLYYVMPYVDGESLRERLNEGRLLPVAEALGIVHAVAGALSYAHSLGLVHRDIKPENILFQAGQPVVSDFGIARAMSSAAGADLTDAGLAVGTPAYISPEQALGQTDVDHRADIYALGVVAYELLAGAPTFPRASAQQTIAAHIAEVPRPIGELRASVPPQVAELVMRCLEKDRERRVQSAAEVMLVLETVTGLELASSARTDAGLAARRALSRAIGIYALAFVAVGATAWSAMLGLGLPDWVFPGSLIVMAAGLPAIFLTAWVHYRSHRTPAAPASRTPAGAQHGLASRLRPYATWRSTTIATTAALVLFVLGVSGFMTMRAAGIGPAATVFSSGALDENDRVLVADFEVRGADSALGPALTAATRAAFEQSTAVRIVSSAAVIDALERMQRPPSQRIDLTVAREVAAREGARAIVQGELTSVGTAFSVVLRLLDGQTGDPLAVVQTSARGQDELIRSVDDLSKRLRGKIGESLKSVRASPPLERVTTPSLEALHKYTAGYRANYVETNFPKAVQLLQEAVALDTAFAMAWRTLAHASANAGRLPVTFDSAVAAAFRHRHRATAIERDQITAFYYVNGPNRDRAKAITAYEALLQRGVDLDASSVRSLAGMYASRREFVRAESLYRRLIAEDPSQAVAHANLVAMLFHQDKLAEAESTIAAARLRFPDNVEFEMWRGFSLFNRGDFDGYERTLDAARNSSNQRLRRWGFLQGADFAVERGRAADYTRLNAEARAMGLMPENLSTPHRDSIREATIDVWIRGDLERGAKRLDAALDLPLPPGFGEGHAPPAAIFFRAIAGPGNRPRLIVQRYVDAIDTSTKRIQQWLIDGLWGDVALAEGRYSEAIALYRRSDMQPDGPSISCVGCTLIKLAVAYDAAGQADSVIAMWERVLAAPASVRGHGWSPPFLHRAYERLGQLYEAKGNQERAAHCYSKFIEIWKDADPDLQPRVAEARRRVAALTSTGASRGM